MKILLGLIGCVLSILIMIYRVRIKEFTGSMEWAERKFGPGGTYTAMLIGAILLFVLSLMTMTNSFEWILGGGSGINFFQSVK